MTEKNIMNIIEQMKNNENWMRRSDWSNESIIISVWSVYEMPMKNVWLLNYYDRDECNC